MKLSPAILFAISALTCAPVFAGLPEAQSNLANQPYLVINGTLLPSAVLPGYYGLAGTDPTNPLKGLGIGINEASTVMYGGHGPVHMTPGTPALTPEERLQWRAAVMRSLDTSKLITYRYGAGERKLLLVTAFDCPYCIALEKRLSKLAPKLNATIIMVPMVQAPNASSMAMYNAIACSADPAAEWRKVMLTRKFPTKSLPECGAPSVADTVIAAAALGELGTPALIREDGKTVSIPGSDDELVRELSSAGKADLAADVYSETGTLQVASAFQVAAPAQKSGLSKKTVGGFLSGILKK